MRFSILFAALLMPAFALAQDKEVSTAKAPQALSQPAFELFRLVPGKTEEFLRGVAIWDQVNAAGGQPKTRVYLHDGGEGWDVMLYKSPRPKPTAAQEAAMAAKAKELGLLSGPLYFIQLRTKVADHAHLVMKGPVLAEDWVAELEKQRAELKRER